MFEVSRMSFPVGSAVDDAERGARASADAAPSPGRGLVTWKTAGGADGIGPTRACGLDTTKFRGTLGTAVDSTPPARYNVPIAVARPPLRCRTRSSKAAR
jgi:hypothetical protein